MIPLRKPHLSRRAVLRGAGLAGLAVALPPLEAMFNDKGWVYETAVAAPPPARLVIFHWPQGLPVGWGAADEGFWYPTQAGANWTMTEGLTPLAGLKDDINIVSGLTYEQIHATVGSHGHASALLTGYAAVPVEPGSPNPTSQGPSVDQFAAQRIGTTTKLASIGTTLWGEDEVGFSFSAAATRNPVDWDPYVLFTRIFSDVEVDPGAAAEALARNQSILDYVKGDIGRLQKKLGKADNVRLEQHLEAIAALEKQISTPIGEGCVIPTAPAQGVTYSHAQLPEYAKLMMDLAAMALSCDVTRVALVSLGPTQNYTVFEHLGVPVDYHNVAHSNGEPGDIQSTPAGQAQALQYYKDIATWHMEQVAYFLGLLKGDGGPDSILASSAFVALSEFSSGNMHHDQFLPVITAGKLGGMATGQNIVLPCDMAETWQEPSWCGGMAGTPNRCINDLWQSALEAVGALQPGEVFGDPELGTTTIEGLWA